MYDRLNLAEKIGIIQLVVVSVVLIAMIALGYSESWQLWVFVGSLGFTIGTNL